MRWFFMWGTVAVLAAATAGCRTGSAARAAAEQRQALAESQFQRAVRLVQSGKRERARETLRTGLDASPDHLPSRLLYAGILRDMGEIDAAVGEYGQAVKTAEARATNWADRVIAYGNRGDCLLETGRFREAEADFSRALNLKPEESALRFKRGECWMGMREYGKALDDFTLTARLIPQDPEPWMRRGDCLFAMTNLDAAVDDYTVALERSPREARLFSRRAAAFEAMEEYTLALADYTQALELEPESSRHWYDRAMIHLALEQPKAALEDFNEALRRDPKRPEILTGRGLAMELMGDDARALQDYGQALLVKPGYAPAENQRRHLLERAGAGRTEPLRVPRFVIDPPD